MGRVVNAFQDFFGIFNIGSYFHRVHVFTFQKMSKKSGSTVEMIKKPRRSIPTISLKEIIALQASPDKPSLQYLGNFFGLDWVTSSNDVT